MNLSTFRSSTTDLGPSAKLVAALLVVALCPATALGQDAIPRCDRAADPRAIRRSHRRGVERYRRAMQDPPTPGAMAEALLAFEAECAAGNILALEFRAYALGGLGRELEAIRTLDALLAAQPLEALPPSVRARITEQRPHLLARVASLSVRSNVADAQIALNGQQPTTLPLREHRLAPGRVELVVSAPGYAPWRREFHLVAGSTRDEFVVLTRALVDDEPVPRGEISVDPSHGDTTSPRTSPDTRAPEPRAPHQLRPWAVATLTGGLVLGVTGIVASVWRVNRAEAYEQGCATEDLPGCTDVYDQFVAARGLQIGTFVGAGVLLGTSVLLWLLDSRQTTRAPPTAHAGVRCAPAAWPVAIECAVRF